MISITFSQPGDFEAYSAAESWCKEHGVSHGSMQGGDPIGLKYGHYSIAKWRNLSGEDRVLLDGTMTGNKLHGPVRIDIKEKA